MFGRWLIPSVLLLMGCTAETLNPVPIPPSEEPVPPDEPPVACPVGSVEGATGDCMAVGPQGCVDLFIEADNLCHPRLDACPAGTIPKMDEGCIPVGITNCADGFMGDDGLCAPTSDLCPEGTYPVPSRGCVPIDGDGCGEGTWGDIATRLDTVFVDTGAIGPGDGTATAPFPTIAQAVANAPIGGHIAIAAGDYAEPVHLTDAVTLEGRCPSMVTISGVAPIPASYGDMSPCQRCGNHGAAIIVSEQAAGVAVRSVRVTGGGYGLVAVGGEVSVSGVHFDRVTGAAIRGVQGAEIAIVDSLIEDVEPDKDELGGNGVAFNTGAHARIERCALLRTRHAGVYTVATGTMVELRDSVVEDVQLTLATGTDGTGVLAGSFSAATLDGVAVVDFADKGLQAFRGTTVSATGCLVRRASGLPLANVLEASQGGVLTVTNSAVDMGDDDPAVVGLDAQLNIERSLVRGGAGVVSLEDGDVVLRHAAITGGRCGVAVLDRSSATIESSVVADTASVGGGGLGATCGITFQFDSTGSVSNSAVFRAESAGVLLGLAGACEIVDTLVEDCGGGPTSLGAIVVEGSEPMVLSRNAILNAVGHGIRLTSDAEAELAHQLIRATRAAPDGLGGIALRAELRSNVRARDIVIDGAPLAGIFSADGVLSLERARIDVVRGGSFIANACGDDCVWNAKRQYDDIGDGVVALRSDVYMADVTVTGCVRAGVVSQGSWGALERVVARGNAFGLALQGDPWPFVDASCDFSESLEEDVLEGATLVVPTTGVEVPR